MFFHPEKVFGCILFLKFSFEIVLATFKLKMQQIKLLKVKIIVKTFTVLCSFIPTVHITRGYGLKRNIKKIKVSFSTWVAVDPWLLRKLCVLLKAINLNKVSVPLHMTDRYAAFSQIEVV